MHPMSPKNQNPHHIIATTTPISQGWWPTSHSTKSNWKCYPLSQMLNSRLGWAEPPTPTPTHYLTCQLSISTLDILLGGWFRDTQNRVIIRRHANTHPPSSPSPRSTISSRQPQLATEERPSALPLQKSPLLFPQSNHSPLLLLMFPCSHQSSSPSPSSVVVAPGSGELYKQHSPVPPANKCSAELSGFPAPWWACNCGSRGRMCQRGGHGERAREIRSELQCWCDWMRGRVVNP